MVRTGRSCNKGRGFSLIEILSVIGVVAVLMGLLVPAIGAVRDRAATAADGKRLKTLVQAYLATETEGALMPGFDDSARAEVPGGVEVSGAAAARYPWRLGPYLNDRVAEILISEDLREIYGPDDHYAVSLMPSFGMNSTFVGGEFRGGRPVIGGRNLASRTTMVPDPSRLIVFASAFTTGTGDEIIPGFFKVTPPTAATVSENPARTGNVHYRYGGKALCAFLDGSVRLMSPEDLVDMRYWSIGAQLRDDPNWAGRTAPQALR